MRLARRQLHRALTRVRSFDAEHARPFVVAEVGHGLGLVGPGVPDDRGVGAALLDANAPAESGVVGDAGGLRVLVDAVGFRGELDGTVRLPQARAAGDLVEVFDTFQTADARSPHV